jgi:hypothetical protein
MAAMTHAAMVQSIYRGLLGRDAEPETEAARAAELAAGRPLEDVLRMVSQSAEARTWRGDGVALFCPPGTRYSPLCDPRELADRFRDCFASPVDTPLPGISLNPDRQWRLWESWRPLLAELPFTDEPSQGFRYHYRNGMFEDGDAAVLYCMLRWLNPARYVEIGSGFSSACALDIVDRYLGGRTEMTLVDPRRDAIDSWLQPGDAERIRQVVSPVQQVDPVLWSSLAADDVLFVDSSHVAKPGSDVLGVLFDVLPRLQPGVVVQFHAILFPFEYPEGWVIEENRSWNEAYLLRAFLTNNAEFEMLFFNDYFRRLAPQLIAGTCPVFQRNAGGSLWLRKV